MTQEARPISHKKLDKILAATTRLTIRKRQELHPIFEEMGREWQGKVTGPPFAVFHWDTGVDGVEVDAGFPVSRVTDTAGDRSTTLEEAEAFTLLHVGAYDTLGQSYSKLYTQMYERGIPASLMSREIYLKYDAKSPQKNVTEIQVLIHDWIDRFSAALERVLGTQQREGVMIGSSGLSPESTKAERTLWVCAAVERLDGLADDQQRYDILSSCAHVFPEERIKKLRAIYEQTEDIDAVLMEMDKDPDWYESPLRDGSIIIVQKVPYDKKAYDKASNDEEKKRAYCHCPMVRHQFDETPPSFCYCGSGWYRRLWEGILTESVQVEMLKSLTRGDNICKFAIHLPSRLRRDRKLE